MPGYVLSISPQDLGNAKAAISKSVDTATRPGKEKIDELQYGLDKLRLPFEFQEQQKCTFGLCCPTNTG